MNFNKQQVLELIERDLDTITEINDQVDQFWTHPNYTSETLIIDVEKKDGLFNENSIMDVTISVWCGDETELELSSNHISEELQRKILVACSISEEVINEFI